MSAMPPMTMSIEVSGVMGVRVLFMGWFPSGLVGCWWLRSGTGAAGDVGVVGFPPERHVPVLEDAHVVLLRAGRGVVAGHVGAGGGELRGQFVGLVVVGGLPERAGVAGRG